VPLPPPQPGLRLLGPTPAAECHASARARTYVRTRGERTELPVLPASSGKQAGPLGCRVAKRQRKSSTDRGPTRPAQAAVQPDCRVRRSARGSRFALIQVDRERVASRLFVGMLCPSCSTENGAGKKFCKECGTAL